MGPRVTFFGRQAEKSTGQAETAPARIPKKERSKERMPQAFLILRIFEAQGRHLMVPELQQRSVRAFSFVLALESKGNAWKCLEIHAFYSLGGGAGVADQKDQFRIFLLF